MLKLLLTVLFGIALLIVGAAILGLVIPCALCAIAHLRSALSYDCFLAIFPCSFSGALPALSMVLGLPGLIIGLLGLTVSAKQNRGHRPFRRVFLLCCWGPLWSLFVFFIGTFVRFGLYDSIYKDNSCPAVLAEEARSKSDTK